MTRMEARKQQLHTFLDIMKTSSNSKGRDLYQKRETKFGLKKYYIVVILKCAYFPADHSNVSL